MGYKYISINALIKYIESLEQKFGSEIRIDRAILKESIEKINDYLDSLKKPSEYKISGAITFYLRKLKPFNFELSEKEKNPNLYLNEIISVLYGYSYIKAYKTDNDLQFYSLSSNFLGDLVVQLRYSSFSPSSIAMLYEAIYLGKK